MNGPNPAIIVISLAHLPAVLNLNARYPLKTSCNGCPVFTST